MKSSKQFNAGIIEGTIDLIRTDRVNGNTSRGNYRLILKLNHFNQYLKNGELEFGNHSFWCVAFAKLARNIKANAHEGQKVRIKYSLWSYITEKGSGYYLEILKIKFLDTNLNFIKD